MNRLELRIDDWIAGSDSDPRRASTSAEFVLLVNDIPATRLYDSWSRTVTDRARLPLYPLAEWLAANWWRLHAEAPFESGASLPARWRLSHDLPGIGGGFIWPRVRFVSDDSSVLVSARAFGNAAWEPVRYINDIPSIAIAPSDFDRTIDDFMTKVLARLNALQISAEPLATIWADVLVERRDPDLTEWRIWEARLGYDPDQVPQHLMNQLVGLLERAGRKPAFEIVPLLGGSGLTTLAAIESLATAPGMEVKPAITRSLPVSGAPWDEGRALAQEVRRLLPTPIGPLNDSDLLDLLGAPSDGFDRLIPTRSALSLGVRSLNEKGTTLHFRKRNRAGLRFEAARFIAESLTAENNDLWLPLTDRGTARQKVQRAFAAELLLPIDELRDLIHDDHTAEQFEEIGEEYGISALAVRSHLANHGYLSVDEVMTTV